MEYLETIYFVGPTTDLKSLRLVYKSQNNYYFQKSVDIAWDEDLWSRCTAIAKEHLLSDSRFTQEFKEMAAPTIESCMSSSINFYRFNDNEYSWKFRTKVNLDRKVNVDFLELRIDIPKEWVDKYINIVV